MEIIHEIVLDYPVICNDCSSTLDAELWHDEIIVHTCEYCLDKARREEEQWNT